MFSLALHSDHQESLWQSSTKSLLLKDEMISTFTTNEDFSLRSMIATAGGKTVVRSKEAGR